MGRFSQPDPYLVIGLGGSGLECASRRPGSKLAVRAGCADDGYPGDDDVDHQRANHGCITGQRRAGDAGPRLHATQ